MPSVGTSTSHLVTSSPRAAILLAPQFNAFSRIRRLYAATAIATVPWREYMMPAMLIA